jgi:GTP cyclohydrolase II
MSEQSEYQGSASSFGRLREDEFKTLEEGLIVELRAEGRDVTLLERLVAQTRRDQEVIDDGWGGKLVAALLEQNEKATIKLYELGWVQEGPGGDYVRKPDWP